MHHATPEEDVRNAGLTRLAGKLRADGLSLFELEGALPAAIHARCKPPLADAEGAVALLRSKPDGATRTEISEHFDRNKTKAQLDAALATLQARGMIRSTKRETGGRAAEQWQLVSV